MDLLTVLQAIGAPKLWRDAKRFNETIQRSPTTARRRAAASQRPSLMLGEISPGHPFKLPLEDFAGHGVICGATGAGKTWGAISLLQQVGRLDLEAHPTAFGIVDGKGDLFHRVQEVLELATPNRPAPVVLDFARSEPVPYALLKVHSQESPERLVDRRMDVFDDVLGRDNQLSLRMSRALRNVLLLAVEHGLGFPMVEFLLINADICRELATRSRDERVSGYFLHEFERERNTTVPAILARLDFLLRSAALRWSFGCDHFVDLREAMDSGASVLINTGGPTVPRQVSRVIQSLVLSDLRQAVFARKERTRPYSWFLDEAQTLMVNDADTNNLIDLLTMARSFGTGIVLLTQSVAAASPDHGFLRQLETNVRWIVMFRCGLDDARLLEGGLSPSGNVIKHRHHDGRLTYLTGEQELKKRLHDVASLPVHEAYAWLRTGRRPATRVRFSRVHGKTAGTERHQMQHVDPTVVRVQLHEQEQRLRRLVGNPSRDSRTKSKNQLGDILARLDQAMSPEGNHGQAQ
jgi:hypothetical protein